MLNSAEQEIFHANKSQITNNCQFFLVKPNWAWKLICKQIWKCQLLLAFSYLLTEKISLLSWVEHEERFITLGQTGHTPSLIWIFAVLSTGSKGPKVFSCGQQRLIRLGAQVRLLDLSCTDPIVKDLHMYNRSLIGSTSMTCVTGMKYCRK